MTSMADPVPQNHLSIPPASSVQVFPDQTHHHVLVGDPHHILINGGYGNYNYMSSRLSNVVSNNSSSSNGDDSDQLLPTRIRSSAAALTLGIHHHHRHHHHINTSNYSISTNTNKTASVSGSSSENSSHLGRHRRKRGNPSQRHKQPQEQEEEEEEEEAEAEAEPGSWLQLGIATQPVDYEYRQMKVRPSTSYNNTSGFSHGGLDLHLAPSAAATFSNPHHHHHTKLISPLLAPPPSLSASPSASSSSACFMQTWPGSVADPATSQFRIIDPPPRRPNSGVWFMLQPSQHQEREPFLPHLSKSFLRIKDGRMTVRLVMKYVANKLGLDSESEVEIKCRGQKLVPILTLEHVRDRIWSSSPSKEVIFDTSNFSSISSPSTPHIMILHYGRI